MNTTTVTHLSGWNEYSVVHYADGSTVCLCGPLKRFQAELPAFIRIHKQSLVNPLFIDSIEQLNGPGDAWCRLTNGGLLKVSRRQYKLARARFELTLVEKLSNLLESTLTARHYGNAA